MPRSTMLPATEWSLDYEIFTAAELRKVVQDRIGATLSDKENQGLQHNTRRQLVNKLRRLDQAGSFPRFMELPPELRIMVYELLLVSVSITEVNQRYKVAWNSISEPPKYANILHPALLRTSKQIYSEAMPILYQQNKFSANILYHERGPVLRRRSMFDGCNLILVGPGGEHVYHQIAWRNPTLRYLFNHSSAMGMLRGMTHLTIKLDLIPPEERSSLRYISQAAGALGNLCLSLTGASNMKKLTIVVKPKDLEKSKVDLAHILWPLMLLRSNIKVKFKGIAKVPVTALTHLTMETEAEESLGSKIAKIRLGCHEAIKTRDNGLDGIHDVEATLRDLSEFGKWLLHIDDIVGLSAKWRGIRSQADRIEASRLEQEVLV